MAKHDILAGMFGLSILKILLFYAYLILPSVHQLYTSTSCPPELVSSVTQPLYPAPRTNPEIYDFCIRIRINYRVAELGKHSKIRHFSCFGADDHFWNSEVFSHLLLDLLCPPYSQYLPRNMVLSTTVTLASPSTPASKAALLTPPIWHSLSPPYYLTP